MSGMFNKRTSLKALLEGLTIVVVLASYAFLITILLSPLLISSSHVAGFTAEQVHSDYLRLLWYLLLPLSHSLNFVHLPMSPGALSHFGDVKRLIMLVEGIAVLGLLGLLSYQFKSKKHHQHPELMLVVLKVIIAWLFVIGILLWVNFSSAFVEMHRFLFINSTWIFNPHTDPIILAMPNEFFATLFLIWLMITVILTLVIYGYLLIITKFRFNKTPDRRN